MSAAAARTPLPPDLRALAAAFAVRLGVILATLATIVATHLYRDPWRAHLALPLWNRLTRTAARFTRAMDRLAAGRAPRRSTPHGTNGRLKPAFPGGRAWLLNILREDVAACARDLRDLLAEPGIPDLLAASPGATRILRPLCNMLGVPEKSLPPRPAPHARAAPPNLPEPAQIIPPAQRTILADLLAAAPVSRRIRPPPDTPPPSHAAPEPCPHHRLGWFARNPVKPA